MIISIFAEKALDKIPHLFTIKNLNTLGIREINLNKKNTYISPQLITYMQIRKQQLELDMEQKTGSK